MTKDGELNIEDEILEGNKTKNGEYGDERERILETEFFP
jgi:hypothetical protein